MGWAVTSSHGVVQQGLGPGKVGPRPVASPLPGSLALSCGIDRTGTQSAQGCGLVTGGVLLTRPGSARSVSDSGVPPRSTSLSRGPQVALYTWG